MCVAQRDYKSHTSQSHRSKKRTKKGKGKGVVGVGGDANHHVVRERSPSELLDVFFFVVFFLYKGLAAKLNSFQKA